MCESWRDPIVEQLASYAVFTPEEAAERHFAQARLVLTDTIAVGLGAFEHPAAQIARRYLGFFPDPAEGAVVWGSGLKAAPDKATFANGVLLRCYDYNDVYFGKSTPGHPSDMIAVLVAAADWKDLTGQAVLSALVLGYEVASALYDILPAEAAGWDHASVTCVAATCAVGKLLSLTFDQMCEAIGIASIQHLQSDEIESCILNRRGDLTMWKRFHGADAMRHALDACMLASVGAEGAVRPMSGRLGFLSKFGVRPDVLKELQHCLTPGVMRGAIANTNLKRWPVGSRAQSAIASTIGAKRKMPAGTKPAAVFVETTADVYNHLVEIRQDPWNVKTREQADHSLPYIVGAAALDGFIDVASFDGDKVLDAGRARFITDKVRIRISEALDASAAVSRVTIQADDGSVSEGPATAGPGHRLNPFTAADVEEKLRENATMLIGADVVDKLMVELSRISGDRPFREITRLLAVSTKQGQI